MVKFPQSLTTITPFSRILAVIVFFLFIISGFLAGMKYQEMLSLIKYQHDNLITVKPSPTPTSTITPTDIEGKLCGGIAGSLCPTGYECKYDGNYPDASGKCAKQ